MASVCVACLSGAGQLCGGVVLYGDVVLGLLGGAVWG